MPCATGNVKPKVLPRPTIANGQSLVVYQVRLGVVVISTLITMNVRQQ